MQSELGFFRAGGRAYDLYIPRMKLQRLDSMLHLHNLPLTTTDSRSKELCAISFA